MTQRLKKSICAIRSVLKNFPEFCFCDWLLLLLDFYYWLAPDSFSKELIFVRKSSTHFLNLLRRIFNYFSKSEFHQKDILPVVVIFVLDVIKTSVQGTPPPKKKEKKKTFCRKIYLQKGPSIHERFESKNECFLQLVSFSSILK